MEYRKYYELVDPKNWRPSQVHIFSKLLCYMPDCLVVVGTEIEFEIRLILFKIFYGNKQFCISPFYD